jgi:type III secretory pathway lipoprotein EscJ
VFIKHKPGFDSALYEDRVRLLVQAAIPGLAQGGVDAVSVVFSPVATPSVNAPVAEVPWPFWWGLVAGGACALVLAGSGWLLWRRGDVMAILARLRGTA